MAREDMEATEARDVGRATAENYPSETDAVPQRD